MKHLKLSLTNKNYYLLERIAKADDRRLDDLIYLIFSQGLSSYFCERSIYIDKDENEFTNEEKQQIKKNDEIIKNTEKFWHLEDDEQKKLGYIHVQKFYSNCYSPDKEDFIDKLSDEIKENALKQINIDNQKIKDEIIKEDTLYKLTSGSQEKSIVNGNSYKESEVK
tara:strand:- start:168 stop:668 length:501 start_codon:yes stop_codon:yes gene_type:complete